MNSQLEVVEVHGEIPDLSGKFPRKPSTDLSRRQRTFLATFRGPFSQPSADLSRNLPRAVLAKFPVYFQ